MNKDIVLGITGVTGAILCAVADLFLDLKGPGNISVGSLEIIQSNWSVMSEWRFTVSIILSALSIPMYICGLIALRNQIRLKSIKTASLFGVFAYIGSLGAIFIHITLCIMPIIFKTLENNTSLAELVINRVFTAVSVPFFTFYAFLVLVSSLVMIIAILQNKLLLPKYFVLMNPLVFFIIGSLLKLISYELFSDLPAIVMPSLGIGAIGVAAIVNAKITEKQSAYSR